MIRTGFGARGRPRRLALVVGLLAIVTVGAPSGAAVAAGDADAVITWNAVAVAAIANPPTATPAGAGQAPNVAVLHLAMVQLAVYDVVNAMGGSRESYLDDVPNPPSSASQAAAVAAVTRTILVADTLRLPQAIRDGVNATYASYIADLPDAGKAAGVTFGESVAHLMLTARANDLRFGDFRFRTGTGIGQWRPIPVNDPNGWVARVTPFSLPSTSRLRTEGPLDVASVEYAREYNEVKARGAATGSNRTPDEELLAVWVTAHPTVMFNATFRALAQAKGLSANQAARLFAMTSASTADAIIACWDDKEYWSFWRPQTAIREGDNDGNPRTVGDPNWTSKFPTPPYPDHPSGYNCYSGAAMHAAKAFFGTDKVSFSLFSPASGTAREYTRFSDVVRDTIDGRILTGFHFRASDVQGAWIGKKAAQWVDKHEFELER